MTEKHEVWAVSEGEYSDYSVKAIFDSEERANAYRALVYGDTTSWGFVEKFSFNPDDPVTITDGLFPYSFQWDRDDRTKTKVGESTKVGNNRSKANRMTLFEGFDFGPYQRGLTRAYTYYYKPGRVGHVGLTINTHVMARDSAHAVKIGADRIREVLAGQRPVELEIGSGQQQLSVYQGFKLVECRDSRNRLYEEYSHVFEPVPETIENTS